MEFWQSWTVPEKTVFQDQHISLDVVDIERIKKCRFSLVWASLDFGHQRFCQSPCLHHLYYIPSVFGSKASLQPTKEPKTNQNACPGIGFLVKVKKRPFFKLSLTGTSTLELWHLCPCLGDNLGLTSSWLSSGRIQFSIGIFSALLSIGNCRWLLLSFLSHLAWI